LCGFNCFLIVEGILGLGMGIEGGFYYKREKIGKWKGFYMQKSIMMV